jgi:hypothetical protein
MKSARRPLWVLFGAAAAVLGAWAAIHGEWLWVLVFAALVGRAAWLLFGPTLAPPDPSQSGLSRWRRRHSR